MSGKASSISVPTGETRSIQKASNGTASPSITFTSESVKDSTQLVRQLNEFVRITRDSISTANSAKVTSSNTIQSVTFTAGQTQNIEHGLNRNPEGWEVVREQVTAWSGFEVALPAGLTRSRYIRLTSNNAGTYDFRVY